MTQEDTQDWVTGVLRGVLRGIATFTIFITLCIAAGYLVAKMEQSVMKKAVPDCGSCKIYKEGVKK